MRLHAAKRKYFVLTLEKKLEIIAEVENTGHKGQH